MKRIMYIISILCFVLIAAKEHSFAELSLKAGYDMPGHLNIDSRGDRTPLASDDNDSKEYVYATEGGFMFSIEAFTKSFSFISLGGGIIYQVPRGIDEDTGSSNPKFNFVPLYGLAKFNYTVKNSTAYIALHLGYNFIFANSDFKSNGKIGGGIYLGFGGGFVFSNGLQLELIYSANGGDYEESGVYNHPTYGELPYEIVAWFSYTKITISAGINI